MDRLRTSLISLSRDPRLDVQLPERAKTVVVAAMMAGTVGGELRPAKNFDQIANQLLGRHRENVPLTRAEIRDAAWCLWETDPPLASVPSFFQSLLTFVDQSARRRHYRALASSFITSFGADRIGMKEVSALLARKAPEVGAPWASLAEKAKFFDLALGPLKIVDEAILSKTPPTIVLEKLGLGTLDAQSGYAKACSERLLRRLATDTKLRPSERLDLVRSTAISTQGKLVFSNHGPLVANALVLPFGETIPQGDVLDSHLNLLIGLFGDPRLRPGAWTSMQGAESVVRRWLVRSTLLQFLEIIDQVARRGGQTDMLRMFPHRKAFWEAVYNMDLIQDAWVVFDQTGAGMARQFFGKELQFARFDGGVQSGQTVLMLRIGDSLVVEWSHNGKCIIWNRHDARDAPRLHRSKYMAHELRHHTANDDVGSSDFAVSHLGSDAHNWQRKVAEKLYRLTGKRIKESSYTVR